jgi:hypothetical protein
MTDYPRLLGEVFAQRGLDIGGRSELARRELMR